MQAEMAQLEAQFQQESPGEELDTDQLKQAIRERCETKLVFEWVQEHCNMEYV